uniref:Retrotransposon gag domain-containing protein n=1 Tax=Fagus sylvatica TaxID=28930 RepID=A0A2N9HSB5_FAGSY
MQQNDNEMFLEFQARWKAKVAKMMNRLAEKNQMNAEMKNLLPNKHQTQYGGQPRKAPKLKRKFDPLGAPIFKIFDHLCKRGHLKPVDPTPYPNPLPKNWDTSLYCHFHQKTGHSTNECTRLKHEIQDLIEHNVII